MLKQTKYTAFNTCFGKIKEGDEVIDSITERSVDVLVTNLIKAVISAPFGDERVDFAGRSRLLAMMLGEIAKAKTSIYDATVPIYIARKFDTVEDNVLLSICTFLERDARIWEWLSEPVRLRVKRLLETAWKKEY